MIKTEYNENNDTTTIYLEYNEANLKKYNVDRLQTMGFQDPEIEIQMNKIQEGGGNQPENIENLTVPYKYFHILMNGVSERMPSTGDAAKSITLGDRIKNSIVNAWNNLDVNYSFRKFNEFMTLGLTERLEENQQQIHPTEEQKTEPFSPLKIKSMILIKVRGHYEIGETYDSIEPKTIKNIIEYKKLHPIEDEIMGVLEKKE